MVRLRTGVLSVHLPRTFGVRLEFAPLELAQFVCRWSKDRSRKVGCVIVAPLRETRAGRPSEERHRL
jgi:hypothetical protein